MGLTRYARSFRLAIQRTGSVATIYRESAGTTNKYGKTDGNWDNPTTVGRWYVHKSYTFRSDRPEQKYTGGGERDEDTPVFLVPKVADIQNGDRIEDQNGTQFEITADPVSYDTHYEVRTQKVE